MHAVEPCRNFADLLAVFLLDGYLLVMKRTSLVPLPSKLQLNRPGLTEVPQQLPSPPSLLLPPLRSKNQLPPPTPRQRILLISVLTSTERTLPRTKPRNSLLLRRRRTETVDLVCSDITRLGIRWNLIFSSWLDRC